MWIESLELYLILFFLEKDVPSVVTAAPVVSGYKSYGLTSSYYSPPKVAVSPALATYSTAYTGPTVSSSYVSTPGKISKTQKIEIEKLIRMSSLPIHWKTAFFKFIVIIVKQVAYSSPTLSTYASPALSTYASNYGSHAVRNKKLQEI